MEHVDGTVRRPLSVQYIPTVTVLQPARLQYIVNSYSAATLHRVPVNFPSQIWLKMLKFSSNSAKNRSKSLKIARSARSISLGTARHSIFSIVRGSSPKQHFNNVVNSYKGSCQHSIKIVRRTLINIFVDP